MGDRQIYIHPRPVFVTSNIIYINGSSQVHRECNADRKDEYETEYEEVKKNESYSRYR